jgi:hypothetical protein
MSVALIQEVRSGIGFKKQADLVTMLSAADIWSLRQTNEDLVQAKPINENDAADLGKGVYITQVFKSNFDSGGPWNGRITSEAAAQLVAFGVGKASKAGTVATGGFKYTSTEPVFQTDGLDMPVTTMVVQIRTSTDAITDKAMVVACEEFGFDFSLGPGRDNATFNSSWIGTGKNDKPSSIVIPAIYAEHTLNAGEISTLTLLGFDYIANKRFVSCSFKWKNNIRERSAFFPGSGAQDGYQLRGRMRRGVPTLTLTAVVECDSGSSEEDALLNQDEGTGIIFLEGATIASGPEKHSVKMTFHRLSVNATPIGNSEGIATYQLDYNIMQHVTDGVVTFECICEQDNILVAAT